MSNKNQENSNHQDYLSLEEATKFCNYSQEYLSLRARQGKLKALKFSNNWVTTAVWLQDYQKQVEAYQNQIKNKRLKKQSRKISRPAPPANLPVKRLFEMKLSFREVNPVLKAVLAVVLITAGVFFDKESLLENYHNLSPYVQNVTQNVAALSDDFFVAAVNHEDTLKSLSDIFKEYGQWVKGQAIELLY